MARYYFDLLEGDNVAIDDEGMELLSIEAAQLEAARSIADMARDAVKKCGRDNPSHRLAIDVRDNDGDLMYLKFTFDWKHVRH